MIDSEVAGILEHVAARTAGIAKGKVPLLEAVSEVVGSAVLEAVAMGVDLVPASKAILQGVLQGAGAKADLALVSKVAWGVIRHTADRGGNLAAATQGLVLGAVASAVPLKVEAARAAAAAARGAYEGASEAGSVTGERVLMALKDPIGGHKVALPEALTR